jgi:hypothetical protein
MAADELQRMTLRTARAVASYCVGSRPVATWKMRDALACLEAAGEPRDAAAITGLRTVLALRLTRT